MSLDADAIVDRRRMRRKLTFWRVSALVIALLAVIGTAFVLVPGSRLMPQGAYIARIQVQGLIRGNQGRVEALARLGKSRARAVIVHIDSPGGTTAGSEQLYNALRELQSKKPMVVVVDGLAASGAYIAALSAEHIVAQETSLVGSIGVLFQYPNFTDVLKTIGIKVEEVKPRREGAPNGFEPTSPEARAAIEAVVLDHLPGSKAWSKIAAKWTTRCSPKCRTGACLPGDRRSVLSSLTARQRKGCIDWLKRKKKVPASTPVRDYSLQPRFSELSFLHVAAWTFEAVD